MHTIKRLNDLGRARVAAAPCTSARRCLHVKRRMDAVAPQADDGRTSLVPETLREMDADKELQAHLANVATKGQAALTRAEAQQRQRSLDKLDLPSFHAVAAQHGVGTLTRGPTTILQLNIGLYCNQACNHCHVESSPKRKEMMDRATADRCLELLSKSTNQVSTLDITGGAPELNTQFRHLVTGARALGVSEIIDRCNLTVLLEPGQEDLAQFLAAHCVRVVASLPCYGEKNVDAQRGAGVFDRSIQALQMLNAQGYGQPGTGLVLDLVYNPGGAFLAPSQEKLEAAYRSELAAYGVTFSHLIALNNMPIKRFADWLVRRGKLDEYMQLLVSSFNAATVPGLMCRSTVSVGWDGRLYDCDFNQQLEMPLGPASRSAQGNGSSMKDETSSGMAGSRGKAEGSVGDEVGSGAAAHDGPVLSSSSDHQKAKRGLTVFDIGSLEELTGRRIAVDNHCYGCTAGSGSSCGGQL